MKCDWCEENAATLRICVTTADSTVLDSANVCAPCLANTPLILGDESKLEELPDA